MMIAALGACESVIDPSTGQAQTRLTVPFSAGAVEAQEERWARCIQFRSESTCERTVPGGRPPSATAIPPLFDSPYAWRRDP